MVGPDDSSIQYSNGTWLVLGPSTANPNSGHIPSYHTSSQYATVTFNFEGVDMAVTGSLDPQGPSPSDMGPSLLYILDGKEDNAFWLNSSSALSRTLYSTTQPLALGRHTLVMTLMTENTTLYVESMDVTSQKAGTTQASEAYRRKVGTIVGGVLGGIFLLVLVIWFSVHHRRRQRALAAARLAVGPMTVSLPLTKEAFTSRNNSHYGLSFSSAPPSTDSLTALPPKKPRTRSYNNEPIVIITPPT
ncbi:hypothetical protein BDN72DRAFT_601773 [Pluteus cervinus]|uniref:Uncharacterized protein n=1 Tax=Pluteus cervinus TaxID=181527 RepID=A0ACD3BBL9_9AGAR|nr:hypothetical protein BDN72DRAFT_601773 [Pluteus cervinus]